LYESDCKTQYNGGISPPVGIDGFHMFYRQNVPAGYDLSLCMVCGNGAQTIKRDNILVQQRSKCYHTMRVKDVGNTGPVEIAYDDTTVRKVYGSGFNDFFINTDPSVCPIQ
jgi:hypothetical protein